jgi:hypothetical protein
VNTDGFQRIAPDNGHAGFVQGIAIPHAAATSTWWGQGSSGWSSQTQPSALATPGASPIPAGARKNFRRHW